MSDASDDPVPVAPAEVPVDVVGPPDVLALPLPEFLEHLTATDPDTQWHLSGAVLLRLTDYIRELEERLEEPVDERPFRAAERARLAQWFETTDLRAYVGQDGISCEFVAFLLRLDHGAP